MKHTKYMAVVAVAVALLLTACGGSSEADDTSIPATTIDDTETTASVKPEPEPSEDPDSAEPIIVEGLESPESAEFHDGVVYASNMGGNEADFTSVDGNGFISSYSPDGTLLEEKFLPSGDTVLNSPKAMTVAGNTLLTVDLDRVVGFDLDSKETVVDITLASGGVTFLNGIELKDDETVYVSDTPSWRGIRGVADGRNVHPSRNRTHQRRKRIGLRR